MQLIQKFWPYVATCCSILITIVSIIFSFIKANKTNKINKLTLIIEKLPILINEAEGMFGSKLGFAKLNYVLDKVHFLCNDFNLNYDEALIKKDVENILSTPTSTKYIKELKNEE